jgi:hypothetical protein
VVRVFPVWPAARDASFRRLRAKGAFLLSATLKGGHVAAELTSEKGSAATVAGAWTKPAVQEIDVGGAVVGPVSATNSNGVVKFATLAGHSYRITDGP